MIRYFNLVIILEYSNVIMPVIDGSFSVEKFGVFISKFHPLNFSPLLPIDLLVPQKNEQMFFKNSPAIPFMNVQLPKFLKEIPQKYELI